MTKHIIKRFNKKGAAATGVIVASIVLLVLLVAGFGGAMVYNSFKQTALQEDQLQKEAEQTPQDKSVEKKSGDVTVLKTYALDKESNTNAQTAVPAFFYTKNADGKFNNFIGTASSTLLSATAATSISPVTIGSQVCGLAFNGTGTQNGFYGDEKCQEIKTEGETMPLDTHTICKSDQLQGLIFSSGDTVNSNMTLGASGSNSFDRIEYRVNGTDCAYNLAGFYIDTVAATNIQDINLGSDTSSITETNVNIQRQRARADFVFELDAPKMLHENEKYKTGSLSLTADGDGCSSTEAINVTSIDNAHFQSASGKKEIKSGIEDDQQSPVDVGGADVLVVSNGKRATAANAQNGDESSSFWCNP